jgi:hypothetical protein
LAASISSIGYISMGRPHDVMVRPPCPGLVPFPDEKTAQEAATAAVIAKQTQLAGFNKAAVIVAKFTGQNGNNWFDGSDKS